VRAGDRSEDEQDRNQRAAGRRSRRLFERAGFVELPVASGTEDAPIAMIMRLAP
jgi:hypothetical protein